MDEIEKSLAAIRAAALSEFSRRKGVENWSQRARCRFCGQIFSALEIDAHLGECQERPWRQGVTGFFPEQSDVLVVGKASIDVTKQSSSELLARTPWFKAAAEIYPIYVKAAAKLMMGNGEHWHEIQERLKVFDGDLICDLWAVINPPNPSTLISPKIESFEPYSVVKRFSKEPSNEFKSELLATITWVKDVQKRYKAGGDWQSMLPGQDPGRGQEIHATVPAAAETLTQTGFNPAESGTRAIPETGQKSAPQTNEALAATAAVDALLRLEFTDATNTDNPPPPTGLTEPANGVTEATGSTPAPQTNEPSAQTGIEESGGKAGATWDRVEICFLDNEHVQVTVLDTVRRLSYSEMVFGDRRGVKVGDRGPIKAWGWLRRLAVGRGTIDLPKRQRAQVPKGPWDAEHQPHSSYEALVAQGSPAAKAREELQVTMKELRRRLCSHFGIKENPILFEQTRYRALFRIGCSTSYHE